MKPHFKSARARSLPLAQLVLLMSAGPLWANPEGGVVVAGSAEISAVPGAVTITQSSDRAIINWQDFSIGEGEITQFVQPGDSSVTLNRVTGGNPSQILGQLEANGHVYLVNRNGVLFGKNAQVNVHSLVATTHDIDNAAFMAGDDRFDIPGRPDAAIVNLGHITVEGAGLAALVAPAVRNDGVITARLGKVALASATGFTLDLYGDQLLQLAVDPVTLRAVNLDGTPVSALVENGGEILAEGGTVLLTANAAREVVDNVINVSGIISATSAQQVGGTIVLDGGDGDVRLTGTLDSSSGLAIARSFILNGTINLGAPINIALDNFTAGAGVTIFNQAANGTLSIENSAGYVTSGMGGTVNLSSDLLFSTHIALTIVFCPLPEAMNPGQLEKRFEILPEPRATSQAQPDLEPWLALSSSN